MSPKRTRIVGILARVVVFLVMFGIVGGEFPELLSLTDNTSNDFTVRKTNNAVSPLPRNVSRHDRLSNIKPNIAAYDGAYSRLSTAEAAELVASGVSSLYSILRT
jgi:hypothetical protein